MSNYGESILSKIVDEGNVSSIAKYSLDESHFQTESERQALRFIQEYGRQNRGAAPSYATFVAECPDITYIPQVSDSYDWLTKKLKETAAKRQLHEFLTSQDFGENFTEMSGEEFVNWLNLRTQEVIMGTQVRTKVGKSLEQLKYEFYDEYQRRKSGTSFKMYKTPYEQLNQAIGGGIATGDIIGIMAESGRGKTYLIEDIMDCLLRQNANVLVKSYEVKAFTWLSRLMSIITAKEGRITDEQKQNVGLPNQQILSAKLEGELEEYFFEMLDKINEYYPGKLYLQAKGDSDLTRTLDELERELKSNPEIDCVVVDPFYGLSDCYGKNANKTTGGAAEQAASRFEQIVGDNDVIGIYAVQATVEKKHRDEEEQRELKTPTRDQVKTSKRLLDIATLLLSWDNVNGAGRLAIEKGRNGGEDTIIDMIALLDLGVIREIPMGEAAASQFNF